MMENVRKISKKYYVRQIVACWLVLWMGLGLPLRIAMAHPSPDSYDLPGGVGGPGTLPIDSIGINAPVISGVNSEIMDIKQTAGEAIVNWHTFDIGSKASVAFDQSSTAMAVLNRVHDGDVSGIMGTLTANGSVFIVNPAGIIFGHNASVNVNQLVASSLGITDGDFLNGLPYTFTGGAAAGDVINEGPTTIEAEQIALIGKNVINRGSLVADEYVIMAAGETVVISESSAVSVVVSMPEQVPGFYDYTVDQGGDEGDGPGTIDADHVILAAGDIWSTAIQGVETLRAEAKGRVEFTGEIHAYAETADSDIVADVTIITGDDFFVDDEITAVADADGSDNAIANIEIISDGDVTINDVVVGALATSEGTGDATAGVKIDADDVTIDAPALGAGAYASGDSPGGNATASLDIDARGDLSINENADEGLCGDLPPVIGAGALTCGAGDAKAEVDLSAPAGSVTIDDAVASIAVAINSGNATASAKIDAGTDVTINTPLMGSVAVAFSDDQEPGGNATASLEIDAGQDVSINENQEDGLSLDCLPVDLPPIVGAAAVTVNAGDAKATVDVDAADDLEIKDVMAAIAAAIDSGNATASTKLNAGPAGSNLTINSPLMGSIAVAVNSKDESKGDATATLEMDAGEDLSINENQEDGIVDILCGGGPPDIPPLVGAVAVTCEAGDAKATVDVDAGDDLVIEDVAGAIAAAINSGNATASTKINAGSDVTVNTPLMGSVAAAVNSDDESEGDATASLDIDAVDNVSINEDQDDGIMNLGLLDLLEVSGDIPLDALGVGDEPTVGAVAVTCDAGDALATVDIDAGPDGDVELEDIMGALACAHNSGNATASVGVRAGDDITISSLVGAWANVYQVAEGSTSEGDATASVELKAGGDVDINESEDTVKASAKTNDGDDAKATIDITAGNDVTIDDEVKAEAYAENESGDATAEVTVIASQGDILITDDVDAEADTRSGSGNASATLTLNAGHDVTVDGDGGNDVEADANAQQSGNATAKLDIDAGRHVLLKNNADDTKADAYVDNAKEGSDGDATAEVTVNAGGDLTLDATLDEAELEAEADTHNNSGDATASITVVADNVYLYGDEGSDAEIEVDARSHSGSGDATGTIDITLTGSDVVVDGSDADIMVDVATHDGDGDDDAKAEILIKGADDVIVSDNGEIKARARAYDASGDATSLIDIEAGSVYVGAGENGGTVIKTKAQVWNDKEGIAPSDATATTKIDVGSGNVTLYDDVKARAEVDNDWGDVGGVAGDATAKVDIDAGNLTVGYDGDIEATADMENDDETSGGTFSGDAKAEVDITLTGNLLVDGVGYIEADSDIDNGPDSTYSGDAIAVVDIEAGGDVTVEEEDFKGDHGIEANADIDNYDNMEINTFSGDADADVYITALGEVTVDGMVKARADIDNQDFHEGERPPEPFPGDTYSGSAYANVWIDNILGDGVTVGPEGDIIASAEIKINDYQGRVPENNVYSGDAKAGIDIETCGDVIVDGLIKSEADFWTYDCWTFNDEYSGDTEADVIIKAYGDVIVNSENDDEEMGDLGLLNNNDYGSNGQILAEASDGEENSASITILAVGDVIVNDGHGFLCGGEIEGSNYDPFTDSPEEIRALAHDGPTNNAFVGIATRDGDGGDVIVDGQIGARTYNSNWPQYGLWECLEEGTTQTNTSDVQIYADQDLIVNGGYALWGGLPNPGPILLEAEEGGQILAAASGSGPVDELKEFDLVSFNTANVEIYTGRDVIVHEAEVEYVGPIKSTELQTQNYGYYDGGQILALTPVVEYNNDSENRSYVGISAGRDVTVEGPPFVVEMAYNGDYWGQILAEAHGNRSINDALIEICAWDDVTVDGDIVAIAGTGIDGREHSAHILIAAGNADGDPDGGIGGHGYIEADADDNADVSSESITFVVTPLGSITFDGITMPEADEIEVPVLHCPDCDFEWIDWEWCEDCEVITFGAPPYPLYDLPEIAGCPVEMGAAALELNITPETIQVAIADALALNPSIQPCQACAALIDAAAILRDEDGSRMAAMLAVFNELAPADAPYTPEMGASIVTAFTGAAEGSQYASVAEYVDAFVRYVAVVDVDLGSPIDDSLTFVMDKYGTGITESENSNLATFVAARLEAGETFAP